MVLFEPVKLNVFGSAQSLLRRYILAQGAGSSWLSVRGMPIHYYDVPGEGKGPPVLLLHGLGGSANGFFQLFNGLKKRFRRVFSPDLPGHGFSALPPEGALPLAEQLELIKAFSNEVLQEPAYVVGNSLGGTLAIQLSHALPQRVRALALVAPAGAKVAERRMAELYRAMSVSSTWEAFLLTRRLFHRAPLYFLLFSSELKKMYGSEAVRGLFREITPDLASLAPEVLSAIAVPVLLLWGQSEKLLPYEGVDFFRAHLPHNAEIHVVKRFGHVPQVERPRELLKLLVRFADAHRL